MTNDSSSRPNSDGDPDSTASRRRPNTTDDASTERARSRTDPPTDDAVDAAPADLPDRTDERADESSFGVAFVEYALRLLVTALAVGARIVWTGARIGVHLVTDRSSRREWRRWLLLEGDRRMIVGGFVAGVFGLALLLGVSDVIGVRESRFVTTMFSTMIAGLFSFIPIVVSVNQLIISRLFGTPDRLTDRIDSVQEFRSRVESKTEGDGVSPTDPAPFLDRLAGTLGTRADDLATVCGEEQQLGTADGTERDAGVLGDGRLVESPAAALESICRFAVRTRNHTDELSTRLTGEVGSVFDVVLPTIDHDYAGAANEARRLRRRFDDALSDRATELLSELRELFVAADATRQYFTTIYLQRELARLSRLITYSGTAAILLSSLVIMIYASGYPPVAFEGWLLVLVSLALAVAFSPLAVLFAYVVRISAILMRTSAPGAFTPSGEYHRTYAAKADDGGSDSSADGASDRTGESVSEPTATATPAGADRASRSTDADGYSSEDG